MRDVITIGSAVYDVFLFSDHFQLITSPKFETGVGECLPLGSKIDVSKKVETTGGGATNAAVTFARLGLKVSPICKVGNDLYGREIVANLKHEKVGTELVRVDKKGETGFSALLTAENGERCILTQRGVSAHFSSADIPWHDLSARWIYVTSLAGELKIVQRLGEVAAKKGIALAWNPGQGELIQGLKAFENILPHVSLLLLNKEEAAELTHREETADVYKALVKVGFDGTLVVTDGNKGATAIRHDGAWTSGTTGAPSVSRTGAGDAFGSGLVASLLKGFPLPTALAIGTLNAESVVGQIGAKTGILRKWPNHLQIGRVKVKEMKK